MPGVVTTPLAERLARYERIAAARDDGMTYDAIGALFDPPLSKQRIARILATGAPRSQTGGRPRREVPHPPGRVPPRPVVTTTVRRVTS